LPRVLPCPHLLSCPTRRSSDLPTCREAWLRRCRRSSPGSCSIARASAGRCCARAPSRHFTICSSSGSSLTFVRRRKVSELPEERPEEHTSELQSRENLVCRLLL